MAVASEFSVHGSVAAARCGCGFRIQCARLSGCSTLWLWLQNSVCAAQWLQHAVAVALEFSVRGLVAAARCGLGRTFAGLSVRGQTLDCAKFGQTISRVSTSNSKTLRHCFCGV